MKKLAILLVLSLMTSTGYSQVKVNFSSFDAWKQNTSTKKMGHIKTVYESGYIEIDKKNASAIVYNNRLNQKEFFQFTPYKRVKSGHYLGFGIVDSQQMLTFIPEDKLLLLKVNDVVLMQFSLSHSDVVNLKNELKSL